jgi:endonuclease VIII
MEGPSLVIAAEEMQAFCGKRVSVVRGNSKIGIERFKGQVVRDVFSWGKHLVWQFDGFALRVHFMLFGSYRADIAGVEHEGDYRKPKEMMPRLSMTFENGEVCLYQCSLKLIEGEAKSTYDFTLDTMREEFDEEKAVQLVMRYPKEGIGDVLLDQDIFAGVGNIIRNEVLYLQKVQPEVLVENLSAKKVTEIVKETRAYVHKFYEWRKKFELKKHYMVYKQGVCKGCGEKVTRRKTGKRERMGYWCEREQVAV